MTNNFAIFLAGFHVGLDFGLWWVYPEQVPFSTLVIVELIAAIGELCLVLRVDKFSFADISYNGLSKALGVAAISWLIVDLTCRFLCWQGLPAPFPRVNHLHRYSSIIPVAPQSLNTSLSVPFDAYIISPKSGYMLTLAVLTQMRVVAWLLADLAVSCQLLPGLPSDLGWSHCTKVIYIVAEGDVHVLSVSWRSPDWDHASILQVPYNDVDDENVLVERLPNWDNVPAWVKTKLCADQIQAG